LRNSKLVDASLSIIGRLQEEDGGITATPLDDAYPYVYPRDAVFMTKALNSCGDYDRSKRFYDYLARVRRLQGEFHQRYNKGFPYVTNEHELDTTPIVLQGIYDTYLRSGDAAFLERMWPLVRECALFTAGSLDQGTGLVHTTNSIHENRALEEGFEIWTNSAAVRGLIDASKMAAAIRSDDLAADWSRRATTLLDSTIERLYDGERGIFSKVVRRSGERVTAPDMSQLAPFYFGIFEDPKTLGRTLESLEGALWNKAVGGFNRFRDFEVVHDWHWYTGGTRAAWPFFTIWAARFYRQLGIREREDACIEFIDSVVTSEDMFIPEKVAPIEGFNEWKANELEFGDRIVNGVRKIERGRHTIRAPGFVCWACPLGWAHAEYILFEKEVRSEPSVLLQEAAPTVRRPS
jgi:GH15 family glucan-1,4-alpha-glucosidase